MLWCMHMIIYINVLMYIDIQAILGCLQSRSNIQRKLNGLGWFTQRKSSLLWMVSFWDDWSLWQTPFLSLALRWSNLTMTLAMSALAGAEHSFDLPWLVGASATRSCDSDQDWWLLSRMVSLGGSINGGTPSSLDGLFQGKSSIVWNGWWRFTLISGILHLGNHPSDMLTIHAR